MLLLPFPLPAYSLVPPSQQLLLPQGSDKWRVCWIFLYTNICARVFVQYSTIYAMLFVPLCVYIMGVYV